MEKSKKEVQQNVHVSDDRQAVIDHAVAEGQDLIEHGETKVTASMVIYRALESYPQEVVVAAMINGAGLTPKGALTYWYNCRKKRKRELAASEG